MHHMHSTGHQLKEMVIGCVLVFWLLSQQTSGLNKLVIKENPP